VPGRYDALDRRLNGTANSRASMYTGRRLGGQHEIPMNMIRYQSAPARRARSNRRAPILVVLGIAFPWTVQLSLAQSTSVEFDRCLNGCFSVCDSGPPSLAFGCREDCSGKCENVGPPPVYPYGAIAFGTQGAEGISWNKGTWAAADQTAIASCSRYSSACKVVYHYQNTCAALAVTKDRQHFEAATGSSEKQAEANATGACQRHWGNCASNMSSCSFTAASQSNQPAPHPQPHAISWGAIAYSTADMQAGWAYGKNDRALAEKEAMAKCSERGKSCALQTAFNKQCGALAADRSFFGWATSADPREAQRRAVEECVKHGGARCVLHIFFCSF
jgi:hypothetical protein